MKHIHNGVHLATVAYQRLTARPVGKPFNLFTQLFH